MHLIWKIREGFLTELADFKPGTLPIDFIPVLQRLPRAFQPWHRRLTRLVDRESELHLQFYNTLRDSIRAGRAPDCFAKLLAEVMLVFDVRRTILTILDSRKREHLRQTSRSYLGYAHWCGFRHDCHNLTGIFQDHGTPSRSFT